MTRKASHLDRRRRIRRFAGCERLERRCVLSTDLPFGAASQDTGEFLLGDVLVTVVLFESDGSIDENTEDWTEATIAAAKAKVIEGTEWWEDLLAAQNTVHSLSFSYDFQFADTPVSTGYEPITRESNDFVHYMDDFLDLVGFNNEPGFSNDIRAFNHSQRLAHGTDWAYTIFVVNDENDIDGRFASGGDFSRAFAFSGGRFYISPAGRPASTFAHETGHIFWARDEYLGGASYLVHRGYYNTQNLNAADNPNQEQEDSIMAAGTRLQNAYTNFTSAPSTLAMIGWQDSDGDGIFDLADVPHQLDGAGYYDTSLEAFIFQGSSQVTPLHNLNSSGLQNDITLNRITAVEYRIDGGDWTTAANFDAYTVTLDLQIAMPATATQIEIRTIDSTIGVTSNVYTGLVDRPTATLQTGVAGFAWYDQNADGVWQTTEPPLGDREFLLQDAAGNDFAATKSFDPDPFIPDTSIEQSSADYIFSSIGSEATGQVKARSSEFTSTGGNVFGTFSPNEGVWTERWTAESRQLRIELTEPTSRVSLDAVGDANGGYARLDAYNANDELVVRATSQLLSAGQVETLTVESDFVDIAYVVARGHEQTDIQFDNLVSGLPNRTTSNAAGWYEWSGLPDGDFRVAINVSAAWDVSNSDELWRPLSLAGLPFTGFNFGLVPPDWHNPIEPRDTNGDGGVAPSDVLVVVNYINANPGTSDPPAVFEQGSPFYDVNADGLVTAQDVLRIVNLLNERPEEVATPEGEAEGEGEESTTVVRRGTFATEADEQAVDDDDDTILLTWMQLPRKIKGG